jgi:hypothetical protein
MTTAHLSTKMTKKTFEFLSSLNTKCFQTFDTSLTLNFFSYKKHPKSMYNNKKCVEISCHSLSASTRAKHGNALVYIIKELGLPRPLLGCGGSLRTGRPAASRFSLSGFVFVDFICALTLLFVLARVEDMPCRCLCSLCLAGGPHRTQRETLWLCPTSSSSSPSTDCVLRN